MTRRLLCVFLCLLLLLPGVSAADDTAPEITGLCHFHVSCRVEQKPWLTDHSYHTYWRAAGRTGWVEMRLPQDQPCYGMYICFGGMPAKWEIQEPDGKGGWQTVYTPADDFYHQYVPLKGLTVFRIYSDPGKCGQAMGISEIRLLGPGKLPDWVQQWHRMQGKADMLVLVAHPDDEYLFLGGTIPYYVGQMHKKVMVAYLANTHSQRKSELLDGLWHCGVRDYPEMGLFTDHFCMRLKRMYEMWDEKRVALHVTRLIRTYRPDVMITQDVNGEYGHAAHKVAADISRKCLKLAADPAYDPQSLQSFGPWQVEKLYLHLYPENQIHMDWQRPLSAFAGRTAYQVADEAFRMHISQQKGIYTMEKMRVYDCSLFGLYFSSVGPDAAKDDFFEHIPIPAGEI